MKTTLPSFLRLSACLLWAVLIANVVHAQSPVGDVVGKITVGYQGWFSAPNDGSPYNNWWHWTSSGGAPSPSNTGIKSWPDTREYATTFPTAYASAPNGRPGNLFSSYTDQTINTQFAWMQEHGIDCAALQRFNPTGGEGPIRDAMTAKVKIAAEAHNVKFYIMYDVSGWMNMQTEMKADWTTKMSVYTSSPAYARQNGKPVVCIWGMGLNDANHPFSSAVCEEVINWFKAQGCYVIGGVRGEWRTVNDGYINTYNAFDMITPWLIGKIGTMSGADDYYNNVSLGDQAYCNAHGIDYQATILPGDLQEGQRVHGDFMWKQFYNMKRLGAQGIYISMFDEYNEGNQIAKTAENQSQIPVGANYLALDEDGVAVSADYYLRLTHDGGKMFKGQIALTPVRPTPYFVNAAPVITNLSTFTAVAGTYLTYNIAASGGPSSFNASGLPSGLSVNTATGLISGIPATTGTYSVIVSATNVYGTGSLTISFNITTPPPQSAYGGTAWAVPGKIEAENFDVGGAGIAYGDADPANTSGQYRTTEGVDLEGTSDVGGGYNIGFTNAGEWTEYTVNVATTGTYTFLARLATQGTGNTFHVEVDGYNISGSVAVPNSGGWQTWENVSFSTPVISAGLHVIRFYEETGGYNINYFTTTLIAPAAPVITSAATATGTVGAAFAYNITATNTPVSYAGTGLPTGLTVNAATGVMSGTPTTAGTYTTTVSVSNAGGAGTKIITITINPATPMQSPYGGTPVTIPGKIEVENYDLGGPGIAYADNDVANSGGQYRTSEGVDIESTGDTGGGYNVGWSNANEWLEYTVNVTTTAIYTLQVRVASPAAGNTLRVELDGVNISGTISVPNTGGWQSYQTVSVTTQSLSSGVHVLRIYEQTGGFNINYLNFIILPPTPVVTSAATASATVGAAFTYNITASNSPSSYAATSLPAGLALNTSTGVISGTPTAAGTYTTTVSASNAGGAGTKTLTITINPATPVQSPYGGTPATIPGKIEVENYDLGGAGIAYADNDVANNGGQYRNSEGVDIESTGDVGGGYNVGWTNANEWLEYTVNVTTAAAYTLQVRVASPSAGNTLRVELDGVNISGTLTIPNTGGWQSYQTVSATTPSLSSGAHVLRIYEQTGGFNINYLNFVALAADPAGVVTCYKTSAAIIVDGSLTESSWNLNKNISKAVIGTPNNSCSFGVLWDNNNLYIGIKVMDATLRSNPTDYWNGDAMEVFIDANNNKAASYDGRDNQFIKAYNQSGIFSKVSITGLQQAWSPISGGYTIELAIPWSQLGISAPAAGLSIGFDLSNDDDDTGTGRSSQLVWNGTGNNYQNTSAFGTLTLSDHLTLKTTPISVPATLQAYPNPLSGKVLAVDSPLLNGSIAFRISNVMNEVVLEGTVEAVNNQLQINTETLTSGVYVLTILHEGSSPSVRFIVE